MPDARDAGRPSPAGPVASLPVARLRPWVAGSLTIAGFAANSLLARLAIGGAAIDAATYTALRLVSGALLLVAINRSAAWRASSWTGGAALAVYASAFSWAYVRIGAALGALVLFPTVKLALLAWGCARGERPTSRELAGALLALAGLVLLTLPRANRAEPAGVALMVAAGLAWAVYTTLGVRASSALAATTSNFVRAAILAAPVAGVAAAGGHATPAGLVLAVVSGAFTSALAYVLWYATVPHLTATQMGLAQLAVPALATLGAVALLGEHLTAAMAGAAFLIFSGIALALYRR
jgi:drug/metabolite transporter (DMT)-like permease